MRKEIFNGNVLSTETEDFIPTLKKWEAGIFTGAGLTFFDKIGFEVRYEISNGPAIDVTTNVHSIFFLLSYKLMD